MRLRDSTPLLLCGPLPVLVLIPQSTIPPPYKWLQNVVSRIWKGQPREFFWDSIVLFVVYSIIGLTAVDVISEYLRGSSVECLVDRETQPYMNSFCSSSVSASEYFPIFMVVHAILIGAPHYLWLNHYGGSFEFFFQLASDMKLLRDENTGEYEKRNHQTVEKLEAAFGTYNRKRIYVWYIVKLVYQCVFTVIGFVVAIFFFTDFDENFPCPRSLNETYDNPQWPLPNQQVNCVFKSLRLIEVIRVADLILLILAFVGLISSFIWCATTHSTELGSKEAAQFSFQSGLAPKYYVPKVHKEMCHFKNRKLNHCCFCCFKLVGAWIKNDFEFMVMKLFRTDGGLGHVLKEVQIDREIKHLNSIERRRLELHKREQNSKFLHSGGKR